MTKPIDLREWLLERTGNHPNDIRQANEFADQFKQLRGNLTLAEDGLASYALEVQRLSAGWSEALGNVTTLTVQRDHWLEVARENDAAVARLQAESDAWDKLSLVQLHKENERLRKALKSVQNLAGGHPLECECRQCEIFELLEPIVGNASPSHEPGEAPSREDEAFRLLNAATYYVPRDRELHADILKWMNESSAPRREAGDRAGPRVSRQTEPSESRSYCPNCDCDYCGSVQGRLERSVKSGEQHGME